MNFVGLSGVYGKKSFIEVLLFISVTNIGLFEHSPAGSPSVILVFLRSLMSLIPVGDDVDFDIWHLCAAYFYLLEGF